MFVTPAIYEMSDEKRKQKVIATTQTHVCAFVKSLCVRVCECARVCV